MTWLIVAAGGAIGTLARHSVNLLVARLTGGQPVPYATAAVNVVGCACIGALAGAVAAGTLQMTSSTRAFVFVGVLGGFTTFSSFALDTLTLAQTGRPWAAVWNVAGQVGVGLLSVAFGYALTRSAP